ncbi:hypothetical protein POF51_29710 [Brevibacillus sp. AG]|uniref:hypothetical protein n=1 Tax=Brevibacillus sp. AG TaxID=3020891 RepID=UPI00232F8069|nr:hypothetical protein [Brevibacillus sp. AG]MDC0764901.1 hypothetical protein [Brevibacillus sp. AG]
MVKKEEQAHQTETNEKELYHTLLQSMAHRFDDALDTIRTAHYEQHLRSFFGELALAPFNNIVHLFKATKIKGILTTVALLGGGYLLTSFEAAKEFVMDHKLAIGISVFLVWYVISAFLHFLKMAKFDNKKDFHIVAFRVLRKAEYQLFEPFVKQKTQIELKAVVEWFYRELRNDSLNQELEVVRQDRDSYLTGLTEIYEELQLTLSRMTDLTHMYQDRMKYMYVILEGVSRNISRVSNNLFDTKSLSFIAPFTLYRLEGDMLIYMDEDRTSGNFPLEIDTNHPDNQDYSSVKAIHSPTYFAQTDAGPLQRRKIASFFIRLTNGRKYVVNFHLDSDNLFFEEDETRSIISLRSIYEIVEAHCNLMDKHLSSRFVKRKEDQV